MSYSKLLEENTALKLLLEEAHLYGNHSWNCATTLRKSDVCDCWYGKSAEMLIGPPQTFLVPLSTLECKTCRHKAKDHTGKLVPEGHAVCCLVNCPCMRFLPMEPKS